MNRQKLSVIIPMYNEENIKKNLKETIQTIDKFGIEYELVVVDDGSKINCKSEAEKAGSNKIKVVGYEKNMGKGFALKYGFKFCQGEYVAFMDADLELHPRQLKNFLGEIENKSVDIAIGSKRVNGSKVYYPSLRKLLSLWYQLIIRILFNLNVRDTQVGMKMFKRKVLEDVFPNILVKKYAFDIELLVNANNLGYKIKEIPIQLNYKFNSGIRLKDIFYMLLDTTAIFYRLYILRYYDKKYKQ